MASGVDAKLLKSTKFPPEYSKKVDMQKVNLEVMKQYVVPSSPAPPDTCIIADRGWMCRWIGQKVVEILATEDDVVIDFIFGMLEENRFVAFPPSPLITALKLTE